MKQLQDTLVVRQRTTPRAIDALHASVFGCSVLPTGGKVLSGSGMSTTVAFTGLGLSLTRCLSCQRSQVCDVRMSDGAIPSPIISRRSMLTLSAAILSGAAFSDVFTSYAANDQAPSQDQNMSPVPLPLPPLPYSYSALEPAIDKETMVLHHDKHFAKYVLATALIEKRFTFNSNPFHAGRDAWSRQ